MHHKHSQWEEAEASYRRAIACQGDLVEAHLDLAALLVDRCRPEEAESSARAAIAINVQHADAHYNLGLALEMQGKIDAAIACYDQTLALRPDHTPARHNHAMMHLIQGRFPEGWREENQWLWKHGRRDSSLQDRPYWTGQPVGGRTVLLRSDAGFGDALQFIRYARFVKQMGCRVVVQCQPQLERLFASCAGIDRVVVLGADMEPFDFHAPLLSLPGIFGTTVNTVPNKVPYLVPAATEVDRWKQELGDGFKIGIAWQGGPGNNVDRLRSVPLIHFRPLMKIPGVRIYSVQMGYGREQLAEMTDEPITDLSDRIVDFHDTAAIMRNLDLVISCETAPAHLAGALGVRVWVPLSFAPDWRWLRERTDSPWYPTMRLFRQTRLGQWDDVFQRIQQAFTETI